MTSKPPLQTLRIPLTAVGIGVAALVVASSARADQDEPGATPFRPTVTSGANLSAPGWLELELGGQRLGGNGADQRNSWPYLLKYSSVRLKGEQIQLVSGVRYFWDCGIGLQGA